MRTLGLLYLWLLLSAFTPGQQVIGLNPQQRPNNASAGLPAVDDSLLGGGYPLAGGNCAEWGHKVPCYNHLSTTRAQTVSSYCTAVDGMLAAVNANVTRLCNGNGALIEEARTNSALWARDMTNAAWVKVGMGNALNATGADGIANSATTLTATGTASSCTASCTILQTLTLGSTADTYSVYLMRVTGTGAVNITINNLVGATACTLVTTGFTRCTVTATLANPVIGIQLTALNDVVIADFNQLEAGSFVTSAVPTTTVAVARAADVVAGAGSLLAKTMGSKISEIINGMPLAPAAYTTNQVLSSIDDGSTSNRLVLRRQNTSSNPHIVLATGGSVTINSDFNAGGTQWAQNAANTFGISAQASDQRAAFANLIDSVAYTSALPVSPTVLRVGSSTSGEYWNGYISRISFWSARLPDATLQSLTQ